MSELLPCPFCGGEAIPCSTGNHFATEKFFVSCGVCGVETPRIARTRKEAISAWNRRAKLENKPLTLDELRQMDGEPVWMARAKKWVFISTVVTEPYAQVWYFFKGFVYTVLYHHEEFYRNKPERSKGE